MLWFYNYTTPRNSPTAKIVNIRNLEGWKDLLETCRADFSPVRLYCININKKKTSTHTDTYTHTRAQTHTHSYISHTNKQHTCETHTCTKVSQKEPRLVIWDADIRKRKTKTKNAAKNSGTVTEPTRSEKTIR